MEPRLLIGADVKETINFFAYYDGYYYSYILSGLIPCLDLTPSVGGRLHLTPGRILAEGAIELGTAILALGQVV